MKSIRDQQDKMTRELAGYGELFKIEDGQMALENIEKQTEAVLAYGDTLRQLKESGVTGGLLDEIIGMGVDDATAYGNQLLNMAPEDLEAYIQAWDEKQAAAQRIAQEFYQDQLDTLETEYNDKLGQALGELTGTAFDSGQDTAEGLINGLKDKEETLYAQARKMADEVSRILAQAHAASGEVDGSHAGGLAFVPYDGYVARLHQGERVLTAQEAKEYIARATPRNFDLPNQKQSRPDLGSMLSQAVNAMGTAAGANAGTYRVEVPLSINGKEFGRAIIDDLRSVMKSNPEVVSDR